MVGEGELVEDVAFVRLHYKEDAEGEFIVGF